MKNPIDIAQSRRAHLQSLMAAAIASSIPLRLLAQSDEPIPELANLDSKQGRSLLNVARTLFPHDMLPDRFYWPIVASIDAAMSNDETADVVNAGLAALDEGYSDLDQSNREKALAVLEGGPFFSLAYSETINGLYLNEEIWQLFGYEGSSIEHGGYLHRGFDKIDWLPQNEESN